MSFKPSDFFLGIVTFFGVLLPGAVLVLLRGRSVEPVFCIWGFEPKWAVFLVVAYIAGQILLAATEILNPAAVCVAARTQKIVSMLRKPFKRPEYPRPVPKQSDFREALSSVRLQNSDAAGEIDQHMADYKLLRNLVAVFLIDMLWSFAEASGQITSRVRWDGVLVLLSFSGFVRMHYWARRLAFGYVDLLARERRHSATTK